LRADDGDTSHAPAFLQARPPEGDSAGAEVRRTRRRRAPREDSAVETPGGDES
jgi:hypothetical protein